MNGSTGWARILRSLPPVLLLAVVVLLGWMAVALWPRLLLALGMDDFGRWFLDSYAVLAASDAVRLGVDPHGPNPMDPLLRNHKYSDWWYALGGLGLTRDHNFLLGLLWVGGFALAAGATARPENFREAAWLGVFLLSPPVLLAVNRANNDLVIFVLLAMAGSWAVGLAWRRQLLAVLLLGLATGLKFYPVVAMGALLWIRPVRRRLAVLLLALAISGALLVALWPQLARGQFFVESGLHTMGAALLGREFGLADRASGALALGLVGLGGVLLAARGFTRGLADQGPERLRLLTAMGIIVLLACFAAGISYAYRWIFAIWPALWLWRRSGGAAGTDRRAARLGCVLLVAALWLDGVLCLVVNLGPFQLTAPALEELQRWWRLATQPLAWLLLMLLAGWLLEGAVNLGREGWRARRTG